MKDDVVDMVFTTINNDKPFGNQFPFVAKPKMKDALRLNTQDAKLFYHAGMIEKSLGNNNAAKDFLKKSQQLNPMFDILQADKLKTALQELN